MASGICPYLDLWSSPVVKISVDNVLLGCYNTNTVFLPEREVRNDDAYDVHAYDEVLCYCGVLSFTELKPG